jgi:hypothetical protein
MDKSILIVIAVFSFLIYNSSKSSFNNDIAQQVYSNESTPKSCDFTDEFRPYPSGHVPGSYLGLSPQEKETLLIRFVDYKEPNGEYTTFQES